MTGPEPEKSRDALERAILGEPPVFNAQQVADQTGATVEEALRGSFDDWAAIPRES